MKKIILTTAIIASNFAVSARELMPGEMIVYQAQNAIHEKAQSKANKAGGTAFVTVGNTNDCDFRLGSTKIQDALDDARLNGTDEVRVAQGTYDENITINDFSVVLKGGYADCAAAVLDNQTLDATTTVIDAVITEPVILVSGSTQRNNVTIDTFQVTGGTFDGFAAGGGITALNSDSSLILNNVWVNNNTGLLGGALSLVSGDTDVTAFNLMIIDNQAQDGGGIYCNGAGGSSIFINGEANNGYGIFNNQATDGDGGGVYLSNGCIFSSFVGNVGGFLDARGIVSNSATGNGGGVYATSGSTVNLNGSQFCFFFCSGYNSEPVNVNLNSAGGNGGGIYATGTDTAVNLFNVFIDNNSANLGGGVLIADNAELLMNSIYPSEGCWSPGSCSQISDNTATATGGAIRVQTGGTADINRVHIQGNRANFGSAFYVINADSSVEGESLLITGNGNNGAGAFDDNNVIRTITDGSVRLGFSTIADNNIPDANEIVDNSSGTVRLLSTIVHEPNPVAIYTASSPTLDTFDCMVVHEDDSLIASGSTFNIIEDDPEFIDRGAGDYHIDPVTSPALDSCDTVVYTPEFNDSDNDERGYDWPGVTNNLGPYDVGYDEQSDLIFANGFEAP